MGLRHAVLAAVRGLMSMMTPTLASSSPSRKMEAAHAVQRLEDDDVLVLGVKARSLSALRKDERGRGVLGKPGGVKLFRWRRRLWLADDDEAALILGRSSM